jgi:hypothetical protein
MRTLVDELKLHRCAREYDLAQMLQCRSEDEPRLWQLGSHRLRNDHRLQYGLHGDDLVLEGHHQRVSEDQDDFLEQLRELIEYASPSELDII